MRIPRLSSRSKPKSGPMSRIAFGGFSPGKGLSAVGGWLRGSAGAVEKASSDERMGFIPVVREAATVV